MICLYITHLCIQLRHVWRNLSVDDTDSILRMDRFRSSVGSDSKKIIIIYLFIIIIIKKLLDDSRYNRRK